MLSKLKKFSRPTIVLICVFGIFLTVYTLRPLLWTGGTGISDTLDKIFWGDIKQSETVVSKTVEKDKQGKTVKTIETIKYDDGKTVWDWLSLLGVPLTLFLLGAWLQQKQQERARELSEEQEGRAKKFAEEQQNIADNETKEEILQTYFDRLSVLLIDRNLIALSNKSNSSTISSEEEELEEEEFLDSSLDVIPARTLTPEEELLDSALDVIRARTLSILRRFKNDPERKTSVIKFLIETGIVGKLKLNLSEADLSGATLSGANLNKANLSGANLSGANLNKAKLSRANLSGANLEQANLSGARLYKADLKRANLKGANLNVAILCKAKLERADLQEANLEGANLKGSDFRGAKFQGADFNNIKCDLETTTWTSKLLFANAKNIPEELEKELGITP